MGIDDKLRSKKGNVVRYFLTDHLGSTEALTDASGAIVLSTSYDSFGNATSNIPTSYQYTGREYDADTGLYYYRNRWYDSETGRFISEDPIGFAGGDINLYGYVGNNPHGYIDPFGFWRCSSNDPPGSSGWWDLVQGALDVAGLAPVVGLPADVLNAAISTARGNYTDAALSMAAAVPVLGTAAGAGKIIGKGAKVLSKNKGGLNLHKWGDKTATKATGWKEGDRFLYLPNKGNPKANWKQNAGRLREEMSKGKPIYDSYRNPTTGAQIKAGQSPNSRGRFLNAERKLLESKGWKYNPQTGAYHPPGN